MENNINFDFNQCVKKITDFGSTTYQNICNGEINTVKWGTGEWVGASVLVILGLIMIVVLCGTVYLLFKFFKEI